MSLLFIRHQTRYFPGKAPTVPSVSLVSTKVVEMIMGILMASLLLHYTIREQPDAWEIPVDVDNDLVFSFVVKFG